MRRLLVIITLTGLWSHSARAQCPPVLPPAGTPVDSFLVDCFTVNRDVSQRCAFAVPEGVCDNFNATAYNSSLLTWDGYIRLMESGFCAMTADMGAGLQIYDFCPRGCFAADSRLLTGITASGAASYATADSVRPHSTLMSMSDDATLDALALAPQVVKRMVYGPEEQDLFVFALANGSTLRVTQHHPMVLDNGKIVEAGDVDIQMSFVGLDGRPVAITAITRERTFDDVFNFETSSKNQLGHILVAEGVLVGDLKLQNELADEEGSIGLRR